LRLCVAGAHRHHAGAVLGHWSASRLLDRLFNSQGINSQLPMRLALLGLGVALALLIACQRAPDKSASNPEPRVPDSGSRVPSPVTFNKYIAPILFENCASCHRPIDSTPAAKGGDVLCVAGAPFPLLDYAS